MSLGLHRCKTLKRGCSIKKPSETPQAKYRNENELKFSRLIQALVYMRVRPQAHNKGTDST